MPLAKIFLFMGMIRNKADFFTMIGRIYEPGSFQYRLIQEAYKDAKEAFRKKYRENGERYFEHLRAVVIIMVMYLGVKDYRLIIAGLLHDIVEDTDWTVEMVRDKYGAYVSHIIFYVTKPDEKLFNSWEEMTAAYEKQLMSAPGYLRIHLIKLADRLHNTMTLWACDWGKQARKIKETIDFYLRWAKETGVLYEELSQAINMIVEQMSFELNCQQRA